ncbi:MULTISPECIES: 6-carboxytetrahydropterin synthase QueD [unclassified Thermotoga]|uniref:6-carboxytetrahydropterin synthase QueD n=1 Tax=unclassified Thermotoga TaxID=2631113 RepID=UPI000280EB68|nr:MULTISPECIES: 6-carboxytetrahydropterin synthase QueD [unclassified Thermotoga]AIY86462.1 putative 6-pyruvoyl tetrahydropterin synthase [Thermotoga sp. 2812B]EJX25903.1 putative 6-pyruvoyl tetrahydropterin synthase [Thermotoga sp. EMP]
MILVKKFSFEAAHNLTKYHGKCERLHGHTYRLVVKIEGPLNEEEMVMDFAELKKIVEELVVSKLDHSYLNDMFDQPTTERIAIWIWDQLSKEMEKRGVRLHEIELWETETSGVVYRGERV